MFAPWRRPRRKRSVQNGPPLRESSRRTAACPLALEQLEGRTLLTAGALDPTFGTGGKAIAEFLGPVASEGTAVAAQPDGKIVVAGTAANRFAVVRYNVNGTLDTTFGTGGQVLTTLRPASNATDNAKAVTIQPDGKIIVAGLSDDSPPGGSPFNGPAFAVVRYQADGRLDDTFASGGRFLMAFPDLTFAGAARGLVSQPDGKIVLAGTVSVQQGPQGRVDAFTVVRLNTNGSLDVTFGDGGKVLSFFGQASSVALQQDGKILVTGSQANAFVTARYLTNGTLDTSFGSGGRVTTFDGAGGSRPDAGAASILVQPDRKILVGGRISGGHPSSIGDIFALARYDSNGSLDAAFGSGGRVTTRFEGYYSASINRVTLQPDGKIVAAGIASTSGLSANPRSDAALARYTVTGTLDPSFGSGGQVTSSFLDTVRGLPADMVLTGSGIVVVGTGGTVLGSTNPNVAVNRFTPSGDLDNSFGTGGRIATHLNGPVAYNPSAILLQTDGKVVLAGTTSQPAQVALTRFTRDGEVDRGFGNGGLVLTNAPIAAPSFEHFVVLQVGVRILVVADGASGDVVVLLRYNPDGSLDNSFGEDGRVLSRLGPAEATSSTASRAVLQSDGQLLVAGTYFRPGSHEASFALARFNPDGSRDPSFTAVFPLLTPRAVPIGSIPPSDVKGLTLQSDGKILLSVRDPGFLSVWAVLRVNPDGGADVTFGRGGFAVAPFAGPIAVLPDQRIVLAGEDVTRIAPFRPSLARFDASGALDPLFATGSRVHFPFSEIADLLVQPDGKIIVAGNAVLRLDSNGTFDPTFATGGMVALDQGIVPSARLALMPDGRLVVGTGVTLNRIPTFSAVRFQADDPAPANPNQRYVTQLYIDLLRRLPDAGGLSGFVTALDRNQLTRAQLVQIFTGSSEYRSLIVQTLYRTYLRREADPAGLNAYVGFLNSSGTVAQLKTVFLSSLEYFQQRGLGTNDGFLIALFGDVFGREADPGARQVFGQALAAGVSRTSLAGAILTSQEALEGIVRGWYARFLRRPAEPDGVTGFVAALRQGMREEQLVSVFTGSDEYVGRL